MKRFTTSLTGLILLAVLATTAQADSFGTGANQFTVDFAPISGSTNPTVAQTTAGDLDGFGIVAYDYRMGVLEITNTQWDKFKASLGVPVTGDPLEAYIENAYYASTNVPTNEVSWYEAAQFVNWLNTSTSHQAAYKFNGTQGQSDYALDTWSVAHAAGGTNLYRHKDAFYFLPTEDEWVKAAYWNGTALQTYATKAGDSLFQGDGFSGAGWNYPDNGFVFDPGSPWGVGSGSEELNGTHDMMGNIQEWIESPDSDPAYTPGSWRRLRGGYWGNFSYLAASSRGGAGLPLASSKNAGFRVASVPEPGTITLLLCGLAGLALLRRRR